MEKRRKEKIKFIFLIILINIFLNYKGNKNETFIEINNKEITYNEMLTPTNYFAKLEIPEISLEKELVNINSIDNNVNKNIEIIFPSKMPNEKNSMLILAAHSGNSNVSYFKDLHKLKINDLASIYYNNKIYTYKVTLIERQTKNKKINIKKDNNKNILILTTCDQKNKSKQIVITLQKI